LEEEYPQITLEYAISLYEGLELSIWMEKFKDELNPGCLIELDHAHLHILKLLFEIGQDKVECSYQDHKGNFELLQNVLRV